MFEAFNLELDPLAKVTSMPEAGCEKLPRLLRALCLHAPLLSTRLPQAVPGLLPHRAVPGEQ